MRSAHTRRSACSCRWKPRRRSTTSRPSPPSRASTASSSARPTCMPRSATWARSPTPRSCRSSTRRSGASASAARRPASSPPTKSSRRASSRAARCSSPSATTSESWRGAPKPWPRNSNPESENRHLMKADIIITGKGHAGTQAILQEEFTCHKLFEAADKTAFLKELSAKVRGLATFGPMPIDGKLMDALPKLEIIANLGVGVDAINLDDAKKRKIIVTNTPDVLNECVADTAIALVLNTLRKFPQSERHLRAGHWVARGAYPLTTSLGGKTLGVL